MRRPPVSEWLEVTDVDAAVKVLGSYGLRESPASRLLLETLFAAEGPLSAEQIARGMAREPESDVSFVYYSLEMLESFGVVRHMHLIHGPGVYELSGSGREYLVCERCDAIRTVESDEVEGMRAAIMRATGFAARFDNFPIFGLCAYCQAELAG